MIFNLHPQRSDKTLVLMITNEVLHLNGQDFDFSNVKEGDLLPATAIQSDWFVGPVTRKDGEIVIELLFPLGPDATTNQRFPATLRQTTSGNVDLTKVERRFG